MKRYRIPHTDLEVSRIGFGCMGLGGDWDAPALTRSAVLQAADLVETALAQGITLFDHADIYTRGKAEAAFGEVLKEQPGLRDRIVLQSKCGIRFAGEPTADDPARYDFSYEHITRSVEGILRRLQTDRLDLLLLHRPDPLVEPEEVARAFDELHGSGKVRYFGVSNHTGPQIKLLRKAVTQPLVVNQLELNLLHAGLIEVGILANQTDQPYTAAAGILDYCRLNDILVQAWSPVARGKLADPPKRVLGSTPAQRAAEVVARLADEKGTTKDAIVLAWLLRHPAPIQPIIGTTTPARIASSARADEVELSREEWYALFTAARGANVP